MKQLLFTATLLAATLLFSCQSNRDYDQMAKELCACMQPLADMNVKVEKAISNMDTTGLRGLMDEIEATSNASEKCATELEAKHGELSQSEEVKAREALRRHCPNIAQILDQAELGSLE